MRCLLFTLFMVLAAVTATLGSDSQPAEVKIFLQSRQVLCTVLFAEGSAALNETARKAIDQVVLSLSQVGIKKQIIRIEGFASPTGTDEVNVPISLMRAKAVVDYIRGKHKFGSDLFLTGYGVREHSDSSENASGRAEIAVYDDALNFDQVAVEKSVLR